MRPVFIRESRQSEFERNGYVIIPQFLDSHEIAHLRDFYFRHSSDLRHGFHATLHSRLTDYRKSVSDEIARIFTPKLRYYFDRFKPVFANYTVKEPDLSSGFDLHLDWSMVDERRFCSLTIWVPLQNITADNGHLWVLEGSHRFAYTLRGGPGLRTYVEPVFYASAPVSYERVTLQLHAGTAHVYDHRLFHGSPPNRTSVPRVAINFTLIPQETESWHYEFRGDRKVEIFEVPPDFYNSHILNTEPEGGKSLGCLDIEPSFLSQSQINSLFLNSGRIISL